MHNELNIAVVEQNGRNLTLGKSLLRAFLLFAPQLFNNWFPQLLANSPLWTFVAIFFVVGGGLALFYGIIFNRTTRQGFHDWAVGSMVVEAKGGKTAVLPQITLFHQSVMLGLLGVGLVLGIVGAGFHFELVSYFSRTNGAVLQDLRMGVWARGECGSPTLNCDFAPDNVARLVFENYPDIDEIAAMGITVRNGYDFGLLNVFSTWRAAFPIEEWREQLELDAPDERSGNSTR